MVTAITEPIEDELAPKLEHKFQRRFREASTSHRITAFFGGLQGGKTVALCDAIDWNLYGPNPLRLPKQTSGEVIPEVWLISKNYLLATTAWQIFRWRCADRILSADELKKFRGRGLDLTRGDQNTHFLKPGADGLPIRIRVRTAADPESMRSIGTLLIAGCDELAHWPELSWTNLLGRGIVTPTKYLISTTPKGMNFCYRDIYLPGTKGVDEDTHVTVSSSADNPWADQKYLAKLRQRFGRAYAQQELDALFVQDAGMVYSFDRYRMMGQPPSWKADYYTDRVGGIDPGYGSAYAAVVLGKAPDGTWWVLQEYKQPKTTVDDILPWIQDKNNRWKVSTWYVDKRRPADMTMLRSRNVEAQVNRELFAENEKRTVMPMIRYVQGLIMSNKLRVAHYCEEIANEFESYHFPDREGKSPGENPVKWMDDLMDALRYACCSVDHYMDLSNLVEVEAGRDGEPNYRKLYNWTRDSYRVPSVASTLADYDRLQDEKEQGAEWNPVR